MGRAGNNSRSSGVQMYVHYVHAQPSNGREIQRVMKKHVERETVQRETISIDPSNHAPDHVISHLLVIDKQILNSQIVQRPNQAQVRHRWLASGGPRRFNSSGSSWLNLYPESRSVFSLQTGSTQVNKYH